MCIFHTINHLDKLSWSLWPSICKRLWSTSMHFQFRIGKQRTLFIRLHVWALKSEEGTQKNIFTLFFPKKNCSKRTKPKIKYPGLRLFLNENVKVYSNLVPLPCLLEISCILQTVYSNLENHYTWWNRVSTYLLLHIAHISQHEIPIQKKAA